MRKFQVCFNRETSEQVTLEVEANSFTEAEELAKDLVNGDEGSLEWEPTDYSGDSELVYCAEVADD